MVLQRTALDLDRCYGGCEAALIAASFHCAQHRPPLAVWSFSSNRNSKAFSFGNRFTWADYFSPVAPDTKKAITLALSSADASPLNGFILFPGTICSGFAMKPSNFALSQMKPAPFMALE